MKRRTELRRTSWMKRGTSKLARTRLRAVNAKRKAKEFARAYGDDDRVTWFQRHPCLICGQSPSENAHLGNGGMSRKSDADQIVPLCGDFVNGCHRAFDEWPGTREDFEAVFAPRLRQQTLAWWAQYLDRRYRAGLDA